MDRSLGFGSAASDYVALFRLAFATAPFALNLAGYEQLAGSLCKKHAVTGRTGSDRL